MALGTRYIIEGNGSTARRVACFADYFEQRMAKHLRKTQPMINLYKVVELDWADDHTLAKFLRKGIPCKCLDQKYKEVKSVTKMGICCNPQCGHPDRKVERSKMFCRTRCSQVWYCSPECQRNHWSRHKQICHRDSELKAQFDADQHADRK